jgi:hypothetical protein
VNFLDSARDIFPDISRTRVYIAGASPEGDEEAFQASALDSGTREFRNAILKALSSAGVPEQQMRIKFNDSPERGWDALFDTRNGKMKITKYK